MEKVDLNKLDTAIKYVQRISDGCHPVSNKRMEKDEVLNDPNVIRCMFFIKEVLEEVRRNDGIIGKRKPKAEKESFPFEILNEFQYQEDKSISNFLKQVHAPAEGRNIKKVKPKEITDWLKASGYLTIAYCQEIEKETTVPTEKGKEIGIYSEIRSFTGNNYLLVIYGRKAQEFLVQNLERILHIEGNSDNGDSR